MLNTAYLKLNQCSEETTMSQRTCRTDVLLRSVESIEQTNILDLDDKDRPVFELVPSMRLVFACRFVFSCSHYLDVSIAREITL